MLRPEEPQAASSIEGSIQRIILPASLAMRPYSVAVLYSICQGPSISLPRHQNLMACGSFQPCWMRRSDQAVPPGWLQYSTRLRAASPPRVPEVHRHHRLDVGGAAPVDEFIRAEGVGLGGEPGEVEAGRALLDRTDTILPVVARDEVAAGIAHDRGPSSRTSSAHPGGSPSCRRSCGRVRRGRHRRSGEMSTKAPNSRGSVLPMVKSRSTMILALLIGSTPFSLSVADRG